MRFWKDPLVFSAPSQRRVWMRLDPDLVPGLVTCICLKDYICTVCPLCHLAKISKFQCTSSQFTYWVSDKIRLLSASRSNLERCFCWRRDPGMQLLPCRRAQQALGCPLFVDYDDWLTGLFAYWLQMLVCSKLGWSRTLTSTMVRWAHYSRQPVAVYCLVTQIAPLWAGCSHQTRHTHYDHISSYHLIRVTGHKGQVKESEETTLTQFSIQVFPNPQFILFRRAYEGSASTHDVILFPPHSRECSSRIGIPLMIQSHTIWQPCIKFMLSWLP